MIHEIRDEQGRLMHCVVKEVETGRRNISSDDQFIQCATLRLDAGTTFRAHQHRWKYFDNSPEIAQESWVVIRGSVKVFFYDTKGVLLEEHIIKTGEASFTYQGGHNYLILEDDTFVFEYKTGPYHGQEADKVFL